MTMDTLSSKEYLKPMFSLLRNYRGETGAEGGEGNADPNLKINSGEGDGEGDGGGSENWYDALDEDLRNNPSITKYKSFDDMVKGHLELSKMIGKEKIVIPTEKSTPEEWNAYFEKIGRPTDLTGYEVPEIKDLPEEIKMRDEMLEAFKQKAHELGLTKKQFAELYALQTEMSQNSFNQQKESLQKLAQVTETDLRKEWGAAYEKKVDGAQQVINTFFKGKGINKAFEILANDKGFVSAMSDIAEKLGEDVITGIPRTTMTPQEAEKEYNEIMGNPSHPLFNDLHPEHNAAVDRMTELRRMMEYAK